MAYDKRYYIKRSTDNIGKHIPDKTEAKMLRKIMADTGLSEEEIRATSKYRWILSRSERRHQKPKRTQIQKTLDKIMKSITTEFKLAKEHPLVVEEFKKRIEVEKNKIGSTISRHQLFGKL